MNSLLSSAVGTLKPYQINQIQEWLSGQQNYEGPQSDVSVQPTLTTIVGYVTPNNA
jgi:hypothetical protein